MNDWNTEFPETNLFAMTITKTSLGESCERIAHVIRQELTEHPEKRNNVPGLRAALNILHEIDEEMR